MQRRAFLSGSSTPKHTKRRQRGLGSSNDTRLRRRTEKLFRFERTFAESRQPKGTDQNVNMSGRARVDWKIFFFRYDFSRIIQLNSRGIFYLATCAARKESFDAEKRLFGFFSLGEKFSVCKKEPRARGGKCFRGVSP